MAFGLEETQDNFYYILQLKGNEKTVRKKDWKYEQSGNKRLRAVHEDPQSPQHVSAAGCQGLSWKYSTAPGWLRVPRWLQPRGWMGTHAQMEQEQGQLTPLHRWSGSPGYTNSVKTLPLVFNKNRGLQPFRSLLGCL